MKKISLAIGIILLGIGVSHGQKTNEIAKVESPFRLFQGVVLKNDFRMTTSILNKVELIDYSSKDDLGDKVNPKNLWLHLSLLNQDDIAQPAIILDGALLNDNSQRLNPVQFPLAIFNRVNRF